jgi:hypothetical protein
MTLPEYTIRNILAKFGPEIKAYLESVGFWDLEGTFTPTDLVQAGPMKKYVLASKAKNMAIWEFLEATLLNEMELSSVEFAAAYGLKEVWNVSDIADAYFKPRAGALIKGMTATDKKRLMSFIWQNSGKNERPLSRMVLKEPNLSSIVDLTGARARTIIRSERHRSAWGSSLEFAKAAKGNSAEWVTVGDSRVRNSHQAQNGVIVALGYAFPNGETYPGEHDMNCRCYLNYLFDETTRTAIKAGTKTPPPYIGLPEDVLSDLYS